MRSRTEESKPHRTLTRLVAVVGLNEDNTTKPLETQICNKKIPNPLDLVSPQAVA